MRPSIFLTVLTATFLVLSACASEPEPADPASEPEAVTADTAADPLSGTWTGDWGPTADHRNAVTVELSLEGDTLSGTVNPDAEAIALSAASFDSETNMVTMEAQAQNFRGETVQYTIDGQLDGNTISGSWIHDDVEGDFSITMQ